MDKKTLKNRLENTGKLVVEFSKDFVSNNLSDNVVYIIQPNNLELSDHLDDWEKSNLNARKKEINKTLTIEKVIDRLIIDDRVPLWINCSVFRSSKKMTIIQLLTSRRFRTDKDLNQNEINSPFHINISFPPYHQTDSKDKFDINWKSKKIQTAFKLWRAKRQLIHEMQK